jgi:hypothetical protein
MADITDDAAPAGTGTQATPLALPAEYEPDGRLLLEYFSLVQVARKVVGVGSVGTRAWILLMEGADGTEPLFLQVVAGQHLMQAESDIFLGWTRAPGPDGVTRDFYVRQLRDWKLSARSS